MKLFDLISMTFRNLLRRKARTLLTMTGVVVGTCAIVVMISLGLAMTQAMEESLAQMGDLTQITIQNYGNTAAAETDRAHGKTPYPARRLEDGCHRAQCIQGFRKGLELGASRHALGCCERCRQRRRRQHAGAAGPGNARTVCEDHHGLP